jgi:hypothetical protein
MKNRFIVALIVLLGGHTIHASSPVTDGFLIPGVDFSKLILEEGAWCRYRIADEALGTVDSSEVYIGVPSREMTPQGPAYWVEIETRPVGASSDEAQVLKLLVLEHIRDFAVGDSLGDYVVKLYNKSGDHPAREEDPKGYKQFSQVIPTMDSSWVATPNTPTITAGGNFNCIKKERVVVDDREIQTGDVKLIKKSRDDFTVWFSDDIPVFRLAKCEIVRVRQTETVPRIKGIPVSGEKGSKTTAELIAFGYDAKPILPIGGQ